MTLAEAIHLKWFLVVLGLLLWHIAVTGAARRRTSPATESFFKAVVAVADLALVVVTLAGIVFFLITFGTQPGAGDR